MRKHHDELSAGCKEATAEWRGKEGGLPSGQPTSAPDDSTDKKGTGTGASSLR
jgi:hypothetical protein